MTTKLKDLFDTFLNLAASSQKLGINLIRIAILIIFVWIGGLKFWNYEAEGIVPFVANSPFMSFFYTKSAPEYKEYKLKEGADRNHSHITLDFLHIFIDIRISSNIISHLIHCHKITYPLILLRMKLFANVVGRHCLNPDTIDLQFISRSYQFCKLLRNTAVAQ